MVFGCYHLTHDNIWPFCHNHNLIINVNHQPLFGVRQWNDNDDMSNYVLIGLYACIQHDLILHLGVVLDLLINLKQCLEKGQTFHTIVFKSITRVVCSLLSKACPACQEVGGKFHCPGGRPVLCEHRRTSHEWPEDGRPGNYMVIQTLPLTLMHSKLLAFCEGRNTSHWILFTSYQYWEFKKKN